MKGKKSNKRHSYKPKSNPNPSQNMCPSSASNSWFTHEYFSKYWQYYNYSTLWYMNHLNYIRNVSQAAAYWPVNTTLAHNELSSSQTHKQQCPPSFHHKKQHRKKPKRQKRSSNSYHTCTTVEPDDTTDSIEMKVPDSLLEFMLVSKKFREEREALKNEQNEKDAQCINIEDVAEHVGIPSKLPPSECPGSQRTLEIKQLYGEKASLIHSMETTLQMTFDQMVDLKQPKMWPNMPLKPTFN